ncbi:MAG: hypothetical protein RL026_2412 [Pseudomonadota bacterium]|jgi:predicted glycoside hydrolase/deacetylase ChbG (UPF0249 family)
MTRITLCADDFGLTAAACRSILELARCGALSATSCCVDGEALPEYLDALRGLRPTLGVGLHLDLTTPRPQAPHRPLRQWLLATTLHLPSSHGRAALARLDAEIDRQFDRFETLFGAAPDHVDGHEHVHQLPGIRERLIQRLQQRYGTTVAVRSTRPRRWRGPKAAVIAALGGSALLRVAAAQGLACNTDFAGAYDLRSTEGYLQRLERWLTGMPDGGLLMCHPETGADALPARRHEHQVLASAQWQQLRTRLDVTLAPRWGADRGRLAEGHAA